MPPTEHWLRRLPAHVLAMFGAGIIERQLVYLRRKYDSDTMAAFERRGGVRLNFKTKQGQQAAWLIPPPRGATLEKLWVFCSGNGGLALEWESFCDSMPFAADGYLLVDYPGYGDCAGVPSPKNIRENLRAAIQVASATLGFDPQNEPSRLCLFGHSLGSAAALLAANDFPLRAVVLCSPFTSIPEMARRLYAIPRFFPLQNVFDNRAGLRSLAQHGGRAWILHGGRDELVPAEMSRTLAREFPETVRLTIVEQARHNDLIDTGDPLLLGLMRNARAFTDEAAEPK